MEPRTITKLRLARLYCPDMSDNAARHWLLRQIHQTPGLLDALKRAGYNPQQKKSTFSLPECRVILRYLGQP